MRLFTADILLVIGFCLTASLANAGNEGAAGGDGVLIDGQVYSLDLVEAGIELNPYLDSSMEQQPSFPVIKKSVSHALRILNDAELVHAVALKVAEIAIHDNVFAWALLDTMTSYSWRVVHPSLIEVDDEDSVVDVSKLDVVQLAVRKLQTISINRDLFAKTNVSNRAALIFHEIIYALMRPELMVVSEEQSEGLNIYKQYFRQSSPRTRQITAQLFIEPLASPGALSALQSFIGKGVLGYGSESDLYLPFTGTKLKFAGGYGGVLDFAPEVSVREFNGPTRISYELSREVATSMCNQVAYFHPHIPSDAYVITRRLVMKFASVEGKKGPFVYRKYEGIQAKLFHQTFKSKDECRLKLSPAAFEWASYFARNAPF